MPLVVKAIEFVSKQVSKSSAFDFLTGSALLAGLSASLVSDKFSLPSFGAPSGLNNVPLTLPTTKPVSGSGFLLSGNVPAVPSIIPKNPSITKALDPAFEAFKYSKLHGEITSADSYSALKTKADAVNVKNAELATVAGASPFLANMVESKSSIDEVAFAINAQSVIHAMTLESLERNLGMLSSALIGIAGLKSMEYEHTESMGAHAVSAKVVTDHAQTKKDILDLDDQFVTHVSPMVAQASYHATKARTATDVNSEEFSLDMIPDVSLMILPFVGQSGIYEHNYVSPSVNPFTHREISI
jgi:hypothetical protein